MSKRVGHIYDTKVVNREFIDLCMTKASKTPKNRKKKGVKRIMNDKESHIDSIEDMVMNLDLKLKPSHERTIQDRNKERIITISPFYPNQALDYMLVLSLEPIVSKSFYEFSVGNIKGRGISYGKEVIESKAMDYDFFVKFDIRKFYHHILVSILMSQLKRRIKDERYLKFIKQVMGNSKTCPIGTYYSQLAANIYLTPFDHFVKEQLKVPFYVRNVDDMIMFSNDKQQLIDIIPQIKKYLWQHLRLKLKFNGNVQTTNSGMTMLGYRYDDNGVKVKSRTYHDIMRTITKMKKHLCVSLARRFMAYYGWLKSIGHRGYCLYKNHLKPFVRIGFLRRYISYYCDRIKKAKEINLYVETCC